MSYILNEDIFDVYKPDEMEIPSVETEVVSDTEIQPEGPEQGEATGIANLIHDLLIDENEAIQGYNNAVANMENYPELQKIMQDIASEEFAHIGELQKALELLISPNASKIEEGEVETENNLSEFDPGSPVDESLNESPVIFNTKLSQDKDKNGQELIVLDRDSKKGQLLVKFPDGSEKWIYVTEVEESLTEDTVKNSDGTFSNVGGSGVNHGKLTKKKADAQRKAMFSNGFKEEYQKEFTCKECGNEFILRDQYMGACDCPECGQWYNIFGQELKDPKYWFENEDEYFDEALNITDDYRALRLIDKVLNTSEITKSLSQEQKDQLADEINVALHGISSDRKKK